MGIYLNPGNQGFAESINSQIYVDKTGLISYTNRVIGTAQKYICVSRPRRFGKTMAAGMLTAYYGRECESGELFKGLAIEKDVSFKKHLNQYDVIFLNMQNFLSRAKSADSFVLFLQECVLKDLAKAYPDFDGLWEQSDLLTALEEVYNVNQKDFIFIIDEWDCIFREKKHDLRAQTSYLDFLRALLKDKSYVRLVYMTGILPVKKYGTHSALNMFDEYSMTDQGVLAPFAGFTENEVRELCSQYQLDFDEMKRWYDGYLFEDGLHIYNPKSVVEALRRKKFAGYWTKTETYEALKIYPEMNFDGLKDAVTMMLGGGFCRINPYKFQNDMTSFQSRDDVMTLLVYLGYLAYEAERESVFIPNREIEIEFANAIEGAGWGEIVRLLSESEGLLEATLEGNESIVAKAIDTAHMEAASILAYNNENALSCVISLAYYSAKRYYTFIRELPTGKGFADIVLLPGRNYPDKPAVLVELKWDESADSAIGQIKERKYVKALEGYQGNLLLVGINYDKESKKHQCKIEKLSLGQPL